MIIISFSGTELEQINIDLEAACLSVVRLKAYHFRTKEAGMDVIKEDQVLDCSGMLCPLPVVKTSKAVKAMEVGQILKMVATDPGAPPDMEAWSRQTGHELLRSMQEDGKFVFFIRRTK